jgi:hypothetical protein
MLTGIPGVRVSLTVEPDDLATLVARCKSGMAYAMKDLHLEYVAIAEAEGHEPVGPTWLGRSLAKLPGWVASRATVDGRQVRVWIVP